MRRLPDKTVGVVIGFVYGPLADNLHRVGRLLRWELGGLHSARRGDYGIVYRIDEQRRTVVIAAVAHRADIYRQQ
jgi:mRNA-degrading endonuclease RelE of RelBE toxin-antitoxin system